MTQVNTAVLHSVADEARSVALAVPVRVVPHGVAEVRIVPLVVLLVRHGVVRGVVEVPRRNQAAVPVGLLVPVSIIPLVHRVQVHFPVRVPLLVRVVEVVGAVVGVARLIVQVPRHVTVVFRPMAETIRIPALVPALAP